MIILILAIAAFAQKCEVYQCSNINNFGRNGEQIMCGEKTANSSYIIDNECDDKFMCGLNFPAFMFDKKQVPDYSFCTPKQRFDKYYDRLPGDICEIDQ